MNIFSEFDRKLLALQDSVDWAVEQLKAKDAEIAELKQLNDNQAHNFDFLCGMDFETLRHKVIMESAELSAANQRADDATGLLRRLWNTAELDGLALSFQFEIATFLNPPVEKSHECRRVPGLEARCSKCANFWSSTVFNGEHFCHGCIQRMLGAPERRP